MKFIYKAYIFSSLLLLVNNPVFGMEEGAQSAKKQKVEETVPGTQEVLSLQQISINKIINRLNNLPFEESKPLKNFTLLTSELNDILSKIPITLNKSILDRIDLITILKDIYIKSYRCKKLNNLLDIIAKLKDSMLDRAITQLIQEKSLAIFDPKNIPFMPPFVQIQIRPTQEIIPIQIPYDQIYHVAYETPTLNNFWYIPEHELLVYFLKTPDYPFFGFFTGYHIPRKEIIFKKRYRHTYSFDVTKKIISFMRFSDIEIYRLKSTAQHPIELADKPSQVIKFKAAKYPYQTVIWPQHVIIYGGNKDKGDFKLFLFKRFTLPKFINQYEILDEVPVPRAQLMVHPTEQRMVIAGFAGSQNPDKLRIIVKELTIKNDTFNVLRDLSHETAIPFAQEIAEVSKKIGTQKEDPYLKQLYTQQEKALADIFNTYITSQFPNDNPLLWEEKRRNVQILDVQENKKEIFIFRDVENAIETDPTQKTTFFGALINLLKQEINPPMPPLIEIKPEPQEPPTGPEGKMEEE